MKASRLGLSIRALRHRRRWRQEDLGAAASVSQDVISRVERGLVGRVQVDTLESIALALDARLELDLPSRGAALDRLLDERHATLVGFVTELLERLGWQATTEVSYSHFGEHGSIDVLGWQPPTRTLVVVEVKSELGSLEGTLRKLDEKVRLSTRIARERFGWDASASGRLLVLPDVSTARRHVERHRSVLGRALPGRGRTVTAWLRAPGGAFAGILFARLPEEALGRGNARERVRRPTPARPLDSGTRDRRN